MRRIYLVTHPEAQHHVDGIVGGWHDSELTARGRLQAERIAEVLASRIGLEPVEVYSSDLRRAGQTAERIARRFFVEVQADARLRERSNGEADGRPQAWLDERRIPLPEYGDRLGHHDGPAGAETRRALVERLYPALDDILRRPVAHQIVVSHGSASSYLIAAWLGMPMTSTDRAFFPLASGSITTLLRNDTHFSHQVVSLNETQHLRGLEEPPTATTRKRHADSVSTGDDGAMPERHSRPVPGGRAFYLTERLWTLAEGLPVESVPIDTIREFDEDCWFGGAPATCRMVARHADRIQKADLRHPVILSADGRLMDGGHRIAKAWLNGSTTIDATRFSVDPEPDYIEWDTTT